MLKCVIYVQKTSKKYWKNIFNFSATFGGKMGVATTYALNGLGPPNSTKKLAHGVDLLGYRYFEIMFSKFSGVNPP